MEAELQQFVRYLGDGFLMLRRVTHDATFSHLPFAHLELGFDQNDQVGVGASKGTSAGRIKVTEMNETSMVTNSASVPMRSKVR